MGLPSPDQTRPERATFRANVIGTPGWPVQPWTLRVVVKQILLGSDSAATTKPLRNSVEDHVTRTSGGPARGEGAKMSQVFVLDNDRRPLPPVHPGTARLWLNQGKVAVFRRYPFTIILNETPPKRPSEPLRVKIDPGSKTTGLAVVNDATGQVVWAAELSHRGQAIRKSLTNRRAVRRNRRQRKTRYRVARFDNRRRRDGLAASLAGEPGPQYIDLGLQAATIVPRRSNQHGVGSL